MADHFDVLVVGAGHGGSQVALALRHRKFGGSIGLLSDESGLPYERPPLSKAYLAGKLGFESVLLRAPAVWETQHIELLPGCKVTSVQPDAHAITLENDKQLTYGSLVWAAGGRARKLRCSGAELSGVHSIRTRTDVDRLRLELATAVDVVIIGGGYIGLEAAATLVELGKKVTVLEALPRLLSRVSGPPISEFLLSEHSRRGVAFRMNASVAALQGNDGRVRSVQLSDGSALPAELVIVGIGIEPNVEPLVAAGADAANGVRVDGQCRTSLPDILAIGDCSLHPNRFTPSAWARLESVPNAVDQATVAARVLMGEAAVYDSIPWFWSDQYDLKLQTVGLSTDYDDLVVRGEAASRSLSVVYLRGGKVVAIDCLNSPRDFVQGKQLILRGGAIDPHSVASAAELKTLVA